MTDSEASSTEFDPVGEGRSLLEPDSRLGVPLPAYGRGRSIANLAASLHSRLRAGPPQEPTPMKPLASDADPFDGGTPDGPVVVLLLDGLGWMALRRSASRNPDGLASRWLPRSRPLTSVFPTTTTIALTSLSTGAAPAQHGVVGHRVYLPRFGSVVELLRMSPLGVSAAESLVGPGWSPSLVSGVESIFRRGVPGVAVSKDRFEGTGFTRLLYDGAEYVGYSTGTDLALSLADVLSRPEPPALVFVYRDDLDLVQHARSPLPELVDLELEQVGSILSFVSRRIGLSRARRTRLLVTGDHGQVPMSADHQLAADGAPDLLAQLARPPSGDRRATYFSARPGRLAALRESLEARLGPGAHLLEVPDALAAGLFGPPPYHPELDERLGDLLLLMPSPGGVVYNAPGGRAPSRRMLGAHGGLEPEELLVPLVSGTFEELASPGRRTAHLRKADPSPPKR